MNKCVVCFGSDPDQVQPESDLIIEVSCHKVNIFMKMSRVLISLTGKNMQLASVVPSSASSLSKQVLRRKKLKILVKHEANGYFHKQDKVKLLRFLAPPFVAAVIALSPISNPPVSFGQTVDIEKGAALFGRACIGCHVAGGNIIQPGATLFLNDLQRNGVDTEEEIFRVTYFGKGRMPGFGEGCSPRGQCTFGARLREDEIKLLAEFVKSQADEGWPNIQTQGEGD